jgi:PBP1b-binding outer membrane lipoprotein LpoB
MKTLKVSLAILLGLVLFSSCVPGYGCPYQTLQETNLRPAETVATTQTQVPGQSTVACQHYLRSSTP